MLATTGSNETPIIELSVRRFTLGRASQLRIWIIYFYKWVNTVCYITICLLDSGQWFKLLKLVKVRFCCTHARVGVGLGSLASPYFSVYFTATMSVWTKARAAVSGLKTKPVRFFTARTRCPSWFELSRDPLNCSANVSRVLTVRHVSISSCVKNEVKDKTLYYFGSVKHLFKYLVSN